MTSGDNSTAKGLSSTTTVRSRAGNSSPLCGCIAFRLAAKRSPAVLNFPCPGEEFVILNYVVMRLTEFSASIRAAFIRNNPSIAAMTVQIS